MKYLLALCLFFALPALPTQAQTALPTEHALHQWSGKVSWFLPADQASVLEREAFTQKLLAHCQALEAGKHAIRHDRKYLQHIFQKTQNEFLQEYASNTPFVHIFRVGKFDCVASVALFALVLDYAHFEYQIFETHNHVYIKVQTTQGEVLLETTNKTQGFVKYPQEIAELEKSYQATLTPPSSIGLKELAGLQFYNQALHAMQCNRFEEGAQLLRKAKMLYNSSHRVERLMFLAQEVRKP